MEVNANSWELLILVRVYKLKFTDLSEGVHILDGSIVVKSMVSSGILNVDFLVRSKFSR